MGGNLFGIGLGELIFLAILALVVFGPRRIPEIARTVGRFLNQVRQATSGLDQEVREWMADVGKPADWIEEGLKEPRPSVETPSPLPLPAPAPGPEASPGDEQDQSPPSLAVRQRGGPGRLLEGDEQDQSPPSLAG